MCSIGIYKTPTFLQLWSFRHWFSLKGMHGKNLTCEFIVSNLSWIQWPGNLSVASRWTTFVFHFTLTLFYFNNNFNCPGVWMNKKMFFTEDNRVFWMKTHDFSFELPVTEYAQRFCVKIVFIFLVARHFHAFTSETSLKLKCSRAFVLCECEERFSNLSFHWQNSITSPWYYEYLTCSLP